MRSRLEAMRRFFEALSRLHINDGCEASVAYLAVVVVHCDP